MGGRILRYLDYCPRCSSSYRCRSTEPAIMKIGVLVVLDGVVGAANKVA
jgi:hypothetical protein